MTDIDVTSATMDALQRTYPRSKVPRPVGVAASWHRHFGYAQHMCDICACEWRIDLGEVNPRSENCDYARCACHHDGFATAVYEGSRP